MNTSQKIFDQFYEIYNNLMDEESQLLYRSLFVWRMLGLELFYKSVEDHDLGRYYGYTELDDYAYFSQKDYRGIILFGSGQNGMEFYYQLKAMQYKTLAFCDNDSNKIGMYHCGLPIISVDELCQKYEDCFVIITPTGYGQEIKKQLIEKGFPKKNICIPCTGFACIYNVDENQYFDENIIKLKDNEVFIDAGAFDGGTAVAFNKACQKQNIEYKKIICFEPSNQIAKKCVTTLHENNVSKFEILEACCFSENKKLRFNNSLAESGAASITNNGSDFVQALSIDNCIQCVDATFIKMDIEGAEYAALQGATETIKRNKPKLAICIYHKTDDIITIPQYIKSLRPDYNFFIRKYTPHHGEIVLYAI